MQLDTYRTWVGITQRLDTYKRRGSYNKPQVRMVYPDGGENRIILMNAADAKLLAKARTMNAKIIDDRT